MKKLTTLIVAAALVLGGVGAARAIDFNIKGAWQFSFDYLNGGNFMGKYRDGKHVIGQQWAPMRQQRDNFEALSRVHLQLHARASEHLDGVIFFEIGESRWGMASNGGALGADGTNVIKLKQAYVDWSVPNTALKFRMGIQGFALPSNAVATPVLQTDVAGITASYAFNDTVSATAFWLRPLNDNYTDATDRARDGYMDNFDLGGLTIPLSFEGLKLTPWGMGGAMGPNTLPHPTQKRPGGSMALAPTALPITGQALDGRSLRDGLYPAAFTTARRATDIFSDEYSSMWWTGITGKWTTFDPFRMLFDFAYGSVDHGREYLNRQGWYAMLVAEYAMDWGLPGIYGWYFSGDDDNPHNGSERMPYISTSNNLDNSLSTFGFRGNPIMGGGKGVLNANPTGTWGVGARVRNLSFLENLSHTVLVNIFSGSNSPTMAGYITGRRAHQGDRTTWRNNTDFNSFGTYLTTNDAGIELNLDTKYKAAENLNFFLTLGYIHLWLDKDTWGHYENLAGDSLNVKDAWKASLNVVYSF